MKLFDEDDIPLIGEAGPAFAAAIDAILEMVNRRADAVVIPAVVGGVVDNTSMIEDLVSGAPYGSTLRFADPGPVGCGAIPVIHNNVRVIGAGGRFGTVLTPLEDTADPILHFDMAGGTTIYEAYGPALERIAIDMTNAPNAIGLKVGNGSGWFEGERLVIKGGYRSIESRGPNATFERVLCDYASDCLVFIDENGLESEWRHVNLARNVEGTTDAYMKVICSTGGGGGDLRLTAVQCQSSPGSGMFVTSGIIITAPSDRELYLKAKRVTIDNVVGGGPGLTLTNISHVDFEGGYINSARLDDDHPGGPPVRISGGNNLRFRGNDYFGGGDQLKTYDFVGGATRGFRSKDNYCPTGPVYWLPASGKPTDMALDDDIPGATDVGQITNDVEGLRAATARRWGPMNLIDRLSLTSVPWMGSPVIGIGNLVAGEAVMAAPDVDSFYSQFIPFRLQSAGTEGRLELASRDPGADTVTIRSKRADGTIETGDVSTIGYLRFEIAH